MPTIYQFGEGTEHHRVYVDESAYPPVSLFDHSGPTPDRTEDGPLYVIQNTKGTATVFMGDPMVTVPVWVQRRAECGYVYVAPAVWHKLVELVPGLVLTMDRAYAALATSVRQLDQLILSQPPSVNCTVTGRVVGSSPDIQELQGKRRKSADPVVIDIDYGKLELRALAQAAPEDFQRILAALRGSHDDPN